MVGFSVRNFGCSCARANQTCHRTTKNTDAVVHKVFMPQLWNSTQPLIVYLVPSMDNQNLGRTTKNCSLVVHGTTIYFSLIRTLAGLLVYLPYRYSEHCTYPSSSSSHFSAGVSLSLIVVANNAAPCSTRLRTMIWLLHDAAQCNGVLRLQRIKKDGISLFIII